MMAKSELIEDSRPIISVCHDAAECNMWRVGTGGVEKIECYGEPGEYCLIPFLKIWKNGEVVERCNALPFRIIYE